MNTELALLFKEITDIKAASTRVVQKTVEYIAAALERASAAEQEVARLSRQVDHLTEVFNRLDEATYAAIHKLSEEVALLKRKTGCGNMIFGSPS